MAIGENNQDSNRDMERKEFQMLSPNPISLNHRHGGGATDGNKIPDRNIEFIYSKVNIPPAQFEQSNANVSYIVSSSFAVINFADGVNGVSTVNLYPTRYKRSISRIRIVYHNLTSSGDLRLGFSFTRGRIGKAVATSSLAVATYASDVTINQLKTITIPRSAYDSLNDLVENDVIALEIERDGGAGADTYNAALEIVGLIVEYL